MEFETKICSNMPLKGYNYNLLRWSLKLALATSPAVLLSDYNLLRWSLKPIGLR